MTTTLDFREAAGDGTHITGKRWRARLIEGDKWGASAFYPNEILARDGARVFHKGLQIYKNHPTETEKYERPERNVDDLIGVLESDAVFEGDGLYADVAFYDSFVERAKEAHKDFGLSVNASGLTEEGERDGRRGPVATAILAAHSVDVVTRAGAGGKLTSILEADRGIAGKPINDKEGNQSMTDFTKEDFEGFKLEFVTAFKDALADTFKGVTPAAPAVAAETTSTEVAPVVAAVVAATTAPIVEAAKVVEIDHAAIIAGITEAGLPAASAAKIVEAIGKGVPLVEAVKAESDYIDGAVALIESGRGRVTLTATDSSNYIIEGLVL